MHVGHFLTVLVAGVSFISSGFAAITVYTSESAWLATTQWSQYTHSQTTETFDTYADRSYISEGSQYGNQSVPIVNLNYGGSPGPSNSVTLLRQTSYSFLTYSGTGGPYSYNPLRVENGTTFGINPHGGSGNALSFYKNGSSTYADWFELKFSKEVRAVSFFLGDLGDSGSYNNVNTRLYISEGVPSSSSLAPNLVWESEGRNTHVNTVTAGQTLTAGNGVWSFLGFTTDDPGGFTTMTVGISGNSDDNIMVDQLRFNTVPEPCAASLVVLGVGALLALKRRRGV